MVLVSMMSACGFIFNFGCMITFSSPSMLRRLWIKDWPSIVLTLGISLAYAITSFSMKPHYAHGLWLLFFRVAVPSFLYAFDAMSVYAHLRADPMLFTKMFGTKDKTGKKHNSRMGKLVLFQGFYWIVVDIARHYLLMQFSKDVNLVTLNVTNPFNNRPVTFNNVDLATALFWGATIFMAQSCWLIVTKKAFQETITDITRYEIVVETSERRKTRVHR